MNDEFKSILQQMEVCIEDNEVTYEFDDLIDKINDLDLGCTSIEPFIKEDVQEFLDYQEEVK